MSIQNLDKGYREALLDVADQASLIRRNQRSSDAPAVLYSPQYWDENPDRVIEVAAKYGNDQVTAVINRVREDQGLPIPSTTDRSRDAEVLRSLADCGLLPSPLVKGTSGSVAFAFTPFKGSGSDPALNAKLLEKTRAILACVRYGQKFGAVTRIRSPQAILHALRTNGTIGPHSEIYQQYSLLIEQGIAKISRSTSHSNRYVLHFIATPENTAALQAAIELLEVGVPVETVLVDKDVRDYAMNQNYTEPPTARASRKYNANAKATEEMLSQIIELMVTQ